MGKYRTGGLKLKRKPRWKPFKKIKWKGYEEKMEKEDLKRRRGIK